MSRQNCAPYRRGPVLVRSGSDQHGTRMRFRRAVASSAALAAGLLIAACAGKTDTVCRADIALDRRFGLLVTPVTIEGTEVPGVLDTGAENSAVTGGLVTRLGLRGDEKNGSLLS